MFIYIFIFVIYYITNTMSTYNRNSFSQRANDYNYGEAANAPTSQYNRDDEYSRRAAGLSHESQSLVGDIMSNRATSSRLSQSEIYSDGIMESDITATHMRPSELAQQSSGRSKPASMDLIDYGRQTQNADFEDITGLAELEEPESSRNGSIQGAVETRSRFSGREAAECKKKTIYKDVGGVIIPTEIKMNKHCVDERFGGTRERAVPLRLKVPTLSGPTETMRQREQARSSLIFETKREQESMGYGGYAQYEFTNTPAYLEADAARRRVTGSIEDDLDKEMMSGVLERAGVIDTINESNKTFEMDRMNVTPSERFSSQGRERARGRASGASRFTSAGEAFGPCQCDQPGCDQCDSSEYDGPARFTTMGEAFSGY